MSEPESEIELTPIFIPIFTYFYEKEVAEDSPHLPSRSTSWNSTINEKEPSQKNET